MTLQPKTGSNSHGPRLDLLTRVNFIPIILAVITLFHFSASAQTEIKLFSVERGKKSNQSRRPQTGRADIAVRGQGKAKDDLRADSKSAEGTQPNKLQGTATEGAVQPAETVQAAEVCSLTDLLLEERKQFWIDSYSVLCLGCRISTRITQSNPGVLGLSLSPSGPWSDSLIVWTNINFQGNGRSDYFYVKGVTAGNSTLSACNDWACIQPIPFTVKPCACPTIQPAQ